MDGKPLQVMAKIGLNRISAGNFNAGPCTPKRAKGAICEVYPCVLRQGVVSTEHLVEFIPNLYINFEKLPDES